MPGVPKKVNTKIVMIMTMIRKFVPQRTCSFGYRSIIAGMSGSSCSYAAIVLCSAPWYSKTRWMSFVRPINQRYPTNRSTRNTPSAMFTSTPFASTRSSAHANSVVGPSTKIATNAIIATASATPT